MRFLFHFTYTLFNPFMVKFIINPFGRIVFNVVRNIMIRLFVPNNVFMVIALPNLSLRRKIFGPFIPQPFCHPNFETLYNRTN